MRIVGFNSEPELLTQFLDFPHQHYASDSNWLPDPDEARLLNTMTSIPQRKFLLIEGDQVRGRVSVQVNPRLKELDGTALGQLGFFECINDLSCAKQLMEAALNWLETNAPQIKTVLAPINFDTWHPYRLRTSGFDQPTFPMEPYNPPYYADLVVALGFTVISQYVTKTVTEPNAMRSAWEPYYQDALARGYRFRSINPAAKMEDISAIHDLSIEIFKSNLFFVDIPKNEFLAMYANASNALLDPELLIFVLDPQGTPVGFSFSMEDQNDPLAVNIKTFGILPQLHGSGVGAALAYEAYRRFAPGGYTRVNHCLMRVGNRADQFDRGLGKTTREYALYAKAFRP